MQSIFFADNAKVYLYYYNPQTKQLEKAAESTYVDGYATFAMTHCSQYLVTDKELQAAGGAAAGVALKRKTHNLLKKNQLPK